MRAFEIIPFSEVVNVDEFHNSLKEGKYDSVISIAESISKRRKVNEFNSEKEFVICEGDFLSSVVSARKSKEEIENRLEYLTSFSKGKTQNQQRYFTENKDTRTSLIEQIREIINYYGDLTIEEIDGDVIVLFEEDNRYKIGHTLTLKGIEFETTHKYSGLGEGLQPYEEVPKEDLEDVLSWLNSWLEYING